jgi:anti-sigma factor RsiW
MAASPPFVREAVLAHAVFVPEKRHPVEVTASDEAHLVQWLSRRLGRPLKVPTLANHGYHLLGGRLLPGDGAPRAQFMFENTQGARVTLYVAVFGPGQAPAQTSFRSMRDGTEESFYWVDDGFGYALSADANAADMMVLAREVYVQLGR